MNIEERLREHADKLIVDAVRCEELNEVGLLHDDEFKALADFLRNEARILKAIANREQYKGYPEFDEID